MVRILAILCCLGLVGCATSSVFGSMYNQALVEGNTTTIIKEGPFEDLSAHVGRQFKTAGYTRFIPVDREQGLLVFMKGSFVKGFFVGEPFPWRIILKFSKTNSEDRTRVDLVNGSSVFWVRKQVDKDIEDIAALIESW